MLTITAVGTIRYCIRTAAESRIYQQKSHLVPLKGHTQLNSVCWLLTAAPPAFPGQQLLQLAATCTKIPLGGGSMNLAQRCPGSDKGQAAQELLGRAGGQRQAGKHTAAGIKRELNPLWQR